LKLKQYLEYEEYNINIEDTMFNDVYLPYLDTVDNYEVYWGGAGSGKSTFVAQKLAIQMTMLAGRNLVVLRKQAVDCRDSAYPEIYNAMSEFNLLQFWHVVEHPLVRMTCVLNGNTILFNGVDDIENIKSIKFKAPEGSDERVGNLTDVWYEEASEEESPDAVDELDRRMRDPKHKSRIILSFNPIFVDHWLKGWMENKAKGRKKTFMFLQTNYKHNRFLPEDYVAMLEDYKYTNPYAYQVYALGQWGIMGQSIFDVNKVNNRLKALYADETRYMRTIEFQFERDRDNAPDLTSMTLVEDGTGETIIYEEPQTGVPYVLSIDTAGGGEDYWAGHVINNVTKNQAAVYHSQRSPHVCFHQLYCLANYYNKALVAPEINFGLYVLEKFLEYGYTNIYQRNKPSSSMENGYEPKYGFLTGVENRQLILQHLVEYVSIHVDTINDVTTLNEMLTFTRQAKRKNGLWIGAAPGAHDDLVMSLAICIECRDQQVSYKQEKKNDVKGFWYPLELAQAVKKGNMDEDVARDYMRRNKTVMEALVGDIETYDFYS
jgi:phage terminase large subunit